MRVGGPTEPPEREHHLGALSSALFDVGRKLQMRLLVQGAFMPGHRPGAVGGDMASLPWKAAG